MSEYITIKRTELKQALEALRFYAEESHHVTLTGFKNGSRIDWDQERDRLEKAGYRFSHENHNSTEEYVEDGGRARDALNNLEEAPAQQAPEPAGRVVSANCEYATVQWLKQTSNVGGGDPKNSRSWPIAGDAVYTAALAQQAEPVAMYETDVQLVGELPEFHLLYVQNSQGTRFAVDQDTELQTELLPGVTYRAQVNAEGYALKISRLHDITDSNKDN